MKRRNKIAACVLCAAMLGSTMTVGVMAEENLPITTEPLTLKVAMPVPSKVEDINTNKLTQYIEEQTGITLEFIELAESDVAMQVNSIMNGGDLPDIFIGYNFPYDVLCSYADAGLLAPLDEYIDEYGTNLKNVILAETGFENALAYATYDDHVWALPSGGVPFTDVYSTFQPYIQMQFLEELGLDFPTTLDELRNVLEVIHENYPDVIPMTAYADANNIFANISQAFQYTNPQNYLKVNDGKVEFIANNEEFKAALQYTKEMVDEGLIDPAAFTQDQNVLATQLAQEGNNVAVLACGYFASGVCDAESEEYQNMKIIGLLEGPNGYKSAQVNKEAATIYTALAVTSACENPEAAFRLFDFFLSDEFALCARVGFEGEQWEKAADGAIARDGEQAWFSLLTTQEWVQPSTNVIWDLAFFTHHSIMNHCEAVTSGAKYVTASEIISQGIKEADTNEALPQLLMDAEMAQEYNEVKNLVMENVKSNIAHFVLGNRSLDEFDDYCAELEAMGVERYVELAQESYDMLTK